MEEGPSEDFMEIVRLWDTQHLISLREVTLNSLEYFVGIPTPIVRRYIKVINEELRKRGRIVPFDGEEA